MKVVLTVDVEPSIAGAFTGNPSYRPMIHEPIGGVVHGKSEALGFLIETLREYGLTATFFVETAHTSYFCDQIMGDHVEQLQRAGQDVQLHLHPCWLSFTNGKPNLSEPVIDQCSDLSIPQLTEIIAAGAARISAWTGTRPSAMRAGNFSASLSVFTGMRQAGLKQASNICLAVSPPQEAELAVTGGIHTFSGVRELPVTCFADVGPIGRGRLRPMQVTALTTREQVTLLNSAHACGNSAVVIVTHPFEFIKKLDFRYTGLRPNRMVQDRFRGLCSFLAEHKDRFDVLPLPMAADALDGQHTWVELAGNSFNSIVRTVKNGLNDRLHFL